MAVAEYDVRVAVAERERGPALYRDAGRDRDAFPFERPEI